MNAQDRQRIVLQQQPCECGGAWVFSNLLEAKELAAKIGTAKFFHDVDGLFYHFSGPKAEPRKFIARSRSQPK